MYSMCIVYIYISHIHVHVHVYVICIIIMLVGICICIYIWYVMFSHSIRNELTQLPESLTNLINLDKLILSYNKLSSLPKK